MKHFFYSVGAALLLALPLTAQAQTGVTIGALTAPDASAALDIVSTTKGVLLPRVALATGVANPATGLIVFQTGAPAGYYYNVGTPGAPSWQQLATAAGAAITASNGLTKTGQNVALGGQLGTPTTIAQAGNNLALTGGSVGIGTAAPATTLDVSGDFRVSTGTVSSTLGTTGSGNANISGAIGQSFTLPVNASITSIRLVCGVTGFSTTFQIYSGAGPSGLAQLATPQPISFTANNSTTAVLTTPLSVPAGVYTVFLNTGSERLRYFNSGDNYPGGTVYSGTSPFSPLDLDFTVAYTSGSATSALAVNANGNVGIGTTGTPGQRLDVTGGSIRIGTSGSGLIFPDGSTQTTAAVTGTGANFIQNQTTQQATSNFNISGNGTVGGTLTAANAVVTTALTGSGANLGTAVGLGIRADGGLNLGQNTNDNFFLGYLAGRDNTAGVTNYAGGIRAGERTTTGSYNVFLGSAAGQFNTTGGGNLYVGWLAGQVSNGDRNFAIGIQAGRANTANDNHFVGFYAGTGTNTGSRNTFEGNYSGVGNTSGGRNTFVGYQAGIINVDGSNNFGFGYNAGPSSGSLTNAGAIGYNARVNQSNSLVLGGTGLDAVKVGIGTITPSQTLDVTGGSIKISTSGQGLIFPDATTQTTAATAGSFIQNQTASAQTGGFNVNGTGTVGGTLTTGAGLVVNSGGSNTGTIANGLRFNGPGAGEGIASKTNAGGNQSGLDFYTNSSAKLSITNGGNVGIGTSALPASRLEVNGGLTLTETASPALTGASPAYVIPANVSTVRLVPDGTTAPTGTVALTSTAPVSGQQLAVYNGTTIAATLNGQTIPAGQAVGFVYSNGGWRASAGQGDNLGNHTATQALNLQGNALTGTGSSIGGVGVGIRADGGLNLSQNLVGNNLMLGFQAGGALAPNTGTNQGLSNAFLGYRAGAATTTGNGNFFAGYQAGTANVGGSHNVAIGLQSGLSFTAGNNNLFLGTSAGANTQTASDNVFGGYASGAGNTTGAANLFLGTNAGLNNTTGSRNLGLGYQAGPSTAALTNAAAIGYNAAVSQSNSLVLGGTGADAVSVGIGTTAPVKRLHVDANSDFLRVDNLASVSNTNNYLVIDNSGNVGKTTVENVAGQLIRLGFNAGNYFENTADPTQAESALRFDANASAALMGSAPNGAANFINTVTGASIATAQAVAAGNGTRARTTDQITLPAGVYRVTVRLCGSYFVSGASGTERAGFVKFIVNNNEYSFVEGLNAAANGANTHAEVSDYLNLSATSTVDFSVRFLRNFTLLDRAPTGSGSGNSYRSLLLIERVR